MHLAIVICSNGLGHFKRATGLLQALAEVQSGLKVDVVCEAWQLERTRDWEKGHIYRDPRVTVHTGYLTPGPQWENDPQAYRDGRLLSWEDKLARQSFLEKADLVISDNLAGILRYRPDAILMGSFLWSDILGEAYGSFPEVGAFVEREQELLERFRPPMLCIGEMAMPAVRQFTRAIEMPWFGQDARPHQERRYRRLALLAGATQAAARVQERLLHRLLAETDWEIALPKRAIDQWLPQRSPDRVIAFDFSPAAFARCTAAICRPGIGTLTDCIVANTPILAFYEGGNPEMAHNARQLETLGIGIDLGGEETLAKLPEFLETELQPERVAEMEESLRARPTDGLQRAARWIQGRFAAHEQ